MVKQMEAFPFRLSDYEAIWRVAAAFPRGRRDLAMFALHDSAASLPCSGRWAPLHGVYAALDGVVDDMCARHGCQPTPEIRTESRAVLLSQLENRRRNLDCRFRKVRRRPRQSAVEVPADSAEIADVAVPVKPAAVHDDSACEETGDDAALAVPAASGDGGHKAGRRRHPRVISSVLGHHGTGDRLRFRVQYEGLKTPASLTASQLVGSDAVWVYLQRHCDDVL
jgi:hypothetical protein